MGGPGGTAMRPRPNARRPPPVTDAEAARRYTRRTAGGGRKGSGFLVGALILHVLAIGVSIAVLKSSFEWRGYLSWEEFFGYVAGSDAWGILVAGVCGQALFAVIAGFGSFLVGEDAPATAAAMMVSGAVAAAFSFLVFGGIVGFFAGILSIVGGYVARGRPATLVYAIPPPYAGPPPRPPP